MPDTPDSRDFISAKEFEIVSDNKSGFVNNDSGDITLRDEWSTSTRNLSGGEKLIGEVSLSNIWDFPIENVYLDESGNLQFKDDTIIEENDSGCAIGDGIISLSKLTGDLDLLKDFDRVNTFGQIYDIQFRNITHGAYKYVNTQVCNIASSSFGFLSLDKLVNDESIRQVKANNLNLEFKGTEEEDFYPPYSGFLSDQKYISEGWINFDQVIHDRLNDTFGYDEEASIAIKTKKFKDTKRVLVNMALTYASNIPSLNSNNKITDFGLQIIDRTTGQKLDISGFKNDGITEFGNSGTATFSGKLEYVQPIDIDQDITCDPCGKYKIIKCEGTLFREDSCAPSSNIGVSHELAPQFRLNPFDTREEKPDILNTIDPIHWTGGTQDFTEENWQGITELRNEFGEDNLYVGDLNQDRAFHYADGSFESGFAVGGFFHTLDINTDFSVYGSRTSTEIWDGKDWELIDYTISTPRASGLGGGDGKYNVITFGTRAIYNDSALDSLPESFVTDYSTSKTEFMDSELDMDWSEADCTFHTNINRHSVAGQLKANKQFTTADGEKLEINTIDNTAASTFKLSTLLSEDIPEEDDIELSLPNDIYNSLSAFVRDASRRASGKGTSTNLKMIGPSFNPDDALLESQQIPYEQNPTDKIPTANFSNKTKGAMDFIIKKSKGTSDNYDSGTSIEIDNGVPVGLPNELVCTDGVSGLDNLASNVESWEHPIIRDDGSVIFVDKSGSVDVNLLKDGQTVDAGDWYELYNISGIAFNGSTGGFDIENVIESELTNTFEYISYVKFIHHSTKRKTGTAYENVTFTFEDGSFIVDPNRNYPIKTIGTSYVGNETTGLATGGKTSNDVFGCIDNAALNIKYGYFDDQQYDEFNNSIVNVAYELAGDAWIRRDNLPENVAFHCGVGDEKHAIFWGGLHASLELPDVIVSFPGCDDWFKAVSAFGGTVNIRGNLGLDSEERYVFFSTRHEDSSGNEYFKSGDYRYDPDLKGVVYTPEWLAEFGAQITTQWTEDNEREFPHIYSATYQTDTDDKYLINYYVNGQSWLGEIAQVPNMTEYEGVASLEASTQISEWLRNLMDNDEWNKFYSSYRADTDQNTLNGGNTNINSDGIYPTRFNYFLNDFENKNAVWKSAGHPVEGAMWLWSRPTAGEELFDPRSIHAEPSTGDEWQSDDLFDKHSFQQHIGYESFFTKLDKEYDDLYDDTSFANKIVKDMVQTVYWVMDLYDAQSQNTYTTLYDYDYGVLDNFYTDFSEYTDSGVAWQHFLSRNAGRARIRSEDTRYRTEFISDLSYIEEGPVTIIKKGNFLTQIGISTRIEFVERLPEYINDAYSYQVSYFLNGSSTSLETFDTTPTGFTANIPEGAILGDFTWQLEIDIRRDFVEMYHHGINKNLNQNHGIPLSSIQKEFRAYYEDSTTVSYFTVPHMQYLLDLNYRLGNIESTKLSPPFISHVPEESLTLPVSANKFSPTPLDVSYYQDVFTNPDMIPPYDQLVLQDHYPLSPIGTMDWSLSRYQMSLFYDSNVNPVTKKLLSYVKTDTENPLTFVYSETLANAIDSNTLRSIYSPKSFTKYTEDFFANASKSGFIENVYDRYVKTYFPDSILSTKLTGTESTLAPVFSEGDENRWDIIDAVPSIISSVYPDWIDSAGIIWSSTNNPSSILTPQNFDLKTIDTTRKTVFRDSELIGKTLNFPEISGFDASQVFIDSLYRNGPAGNILIDTLGVILDENLLETSRTQLFRTSHDLINLLSFGNKIDIFGGLFDVFHHNNFTRISNYGITPFLNPEPRMRGITTISFDNNITYYEDWDYGWNTNGGDNYLTDVISTSGGGVYLPPIEDVPVTYLTDYVENYTFSAPVSAALAVAVDPYNMSTSYDGPGTPIISNLTTTGFTLTIEDWYPLVHEVFTMVGPIIVVSLEEDARVFNWFINFDEDKLPNSIVIDPFNQASNVIASNKIVYSTKEDRHERLRAVYDDNHWPDGYASKNFTLLNDSVIYDTKNPEIAFSYDYGFERTFIDPLANISGSNMTVSYDYYRYRFKNVAEDMENWLYVPYSEEIENDIFKLNNIATSDVTPEYMTYTFFMDRSCKGLEQFLYGGSNNTFVERWKFPYATEVLNNLEITKSIDGIDTLVTKNNDGTGNFIDIQNYGIFKTGSLSVGNFAFPSITENQIAANIENPLKDIFRYIAESTSTGTSGASGADANWDELYTFLDADNDDSGSKTCYYPLSYDPYAGNSALLPQLPYFKYCADSQFRFDNTKESSTIRDKSALWPWNDLLQGDPTNKPTLGDFTWQFTKDGNFWLAEVSEISVNDGIDPLGREVTTNVYGVGDINREVYRIRCYTVRGELLFDYNITYDEHAGPEMEVTKQIASDFNLFGDELKNKSIELEHFNTRPVNGPTQIDSINDQETVWTATQWNHFSIDMDKPTYRYRESDLCDMITNSFNKGTVPSEGNLCKINDVTDVWVYSVPFDTAEINGAVVDRSLWIEENPLAVTEYITGSPVGFYDINNDLIENITTVDVENTSANPIGSQIIFKASYSGNDGNDGLRYSRALVTGPSSKGLGQFNFGKSQAYGGDLLHYGPREFSKYSDTDTTNIIPGYSQLSKSWPWNVIGNNGELGPKGFTDTVDVSGNYWFAYGDQDNLTEIEIAQSPDVDFTAAYIIGMISSSKLSDFKVALMDTNYIRAKDALDILEIADSNPDIIEFSFIQAENFGARFREGIMEVVNSQNGQDFFELFVYLIDENVINVDVAGRENEKSIAETTDNTPVALLPSLPLPALGAVDNIQIVQDLIILSADDPTCILCEVCGTDTSNYDDLENPTVWKQHNHDDWVAPWLESPFAGPYNSNGFNVWLVAGENNNWGTQVWADLQNGKVWISYKRQRVHVDKVRGNVALQIISGSISIEDFSSASEQDFNIPVYCTYDEFLFEYDDYKDLDIVKKLLKDQDNEKIFRYGVDCDDSFSVYSPINVDSSVISGASVETSASIICPDQTPNESYTEWASSFIQEYKERNLILGTDFIGKYFSRYDTNNTYDTNTFLSPESITEKEIIGTDWRRYQDGVGIGGGAPLLNIVTQDVDTRCVILNECYIGQKAFGTPDKAVLSGGFVVSADGGVVREDKWWRRFTATSTIKWNTGVISPEDSLNENYRNRTLSPFFTNGDQTNSNLSLGYIMFDLGKEAMIERQGVAQFNDQNIFNVEFNDEIPDFFSNSDKYSIVLQPDQNIKSWWADKTANGFTIQVELENWTGSVDWQIVLIDNVPADNVDGIEDYETFDKWDGL